MDKRTFKNITITKDYPGLAWMGSGIYKYKGDINAKNLNIEVPLKVIGDINVLDLLCVGDTINCDDIHCKGYWAASISMGNKGYKTLCCTGKITTRQICCVISIDIISTCGK